MDVNDPDSIAFRFLSYLNSLGAGRKGGAHIIELGWELGLSNNETRDVAQYLRSLGMFELRPGSRGYTGEDHILSLFATISELGREHVRATSAITNKDNAD
jgi:hypothetical protein